MHVVKGVGLKGPCLVAVLDLATGYPIVSSLLFVSDWLGVRGFRRVSYKLRLGGTQEGWMGEMSVPMTLVEGNSSAKSLSESSVSE
jgi:hypothetical protein